MEADAVDNVGVGAVVLKQLMAADVPEFDGGVCGTSSNDTAVGMELNRVDRGCVLVVGMDTLVSAYIPQFDSFVIAATHDQAVVRAKAHGLDPVNVTHQGEAETELAGTHQLPDFACFVIRCRADVFAVVREGDVSDRGGVCLQDGGFSPNRRLPDTHRAVQRGRSQQGAIGVEANCCHGFFVAQKPESSELRFEVPNHDAVISASGCQLFLYFRGVGLGTLGKWQCRINYDPRSDYRLLGIA